MRAAGLVLLLALIAGACTVTHSVAPPAETIGESGEAAILAAQGTPHILWFWGAN